MKYLYIFVVFLNQIRGHNVGIRCSEELGIPCFNIFEEQLQELPRRSPGSVGDKVTEDVGGGRLQTLITRATDPPIFELPGFLTEEECDHMVKLATDKGLEESKVYGNDDSITVSSVRSGQVTFIPGASDQVLRGIQDRAMAMTKLPEDMIYHSEMFQLGLYEVGGFYTFHYDSHPVSREVLMEKPCCQHSTAPFHGSKCTICRFLTILMYLNDVEEGGETAFPLADVPEIPSTEDHKHMNVSCKSAPVLVPPKKGNAVMWYNNIIDPEHGWLGVHDVRALHGGCPILKGRKWISNLWINAPQYHSVNKRTLYHDEL